MLPYSILVVDDDEDLRALYVTTLQDEGFRAFGAGGREAIDRMQIEKPHFIVLDLLMPDLTGEDLLKIVRERQHLRDVIIIILSVQNDLDTKLRCLSAGAHEFLVKPVDPREITARIHRFLRMRDEFRTQSSESRPAVEKHFIVASASKDADRSHGTVDVVSGPGGDSFARIRPQYGIYRVENLIGSGGMGYVFKAYEESLDRYVAIKILSRKFSNSPEFLERFRREAKVLAAINHPGIAFIYSFGEEEGESYFAMQWCPGGSLSDLIRRKGRLELLPSVDTILQCAQALFAASKKGIVHRDIKPSNLLFDENQQIKIVDFGLASAQKNSVRITQVQEFLGTPSFMAPEQAQNASVDHRADIYSLGITFYFILYGKYPYEANSPIEMLIKHASEPFPSYDDLGGLIPKSAYDIIAKMTQKSPGDRYLDYPALIADLEKLRNDLLSKSQWKIPRVERLNSMPTLVDTNLFEMLSAVYSQSASGVLLVNWSTLQKKFLFRQRELVLFESSQPDDNIWMTLVKKNVLVQEDIPPKTEDFEKSLNRFLLKQKFTIEEFKVTYRQLMKAALMQVFFWPVFHGEFSAGAIEHDAFATIRVADVLVESARNLVPLEHIKKRVQVDTVLLRTSQFDPVLSTLDLKPEESFLASRMEGQDTTPNTLMLLTGMNEERIARFVYTLERMGAIQFRVTEEKRARKPEPQAPAMPPKETTPTPTPTMMPRVVERDRPRVAEPPKIDPAPPTPPPSRRSDEPTPTPTSRADVVRMDVQKSDKRLEVDHNVKVAEQFYRLAHDKFLEMDFWKVTELCKQAIKHNPSESKYYHLMANAYAQHPRFRKDAEQCYYKAIEVDPWNPDFHLDLARFYLQQGLPTRALSQCEKVLRISPQHPQALELMTQLNAKK